MEIREIKDKKIWENFLLDCKEKTFLQSWNWGEFNKSMGDSAYRLGVFENNNLISTAQIIKVCAKRGTFLFIPHGPNVKNQKSEINKKVLRILLGELKKKAKKEKMSLIKISPIWKKNEENVKTFTDFGFRPAPIHIHPELTWELDISPSEEDLLAQMRKTTRYLIRKSLKNEEIKVTKDHTAESIKKFDKLYQSTKDRKMFVPFSLDYLKNEFLNFSSDNQISVFLGKYKGEVVSAGIFVFWQDTCFYHHGASSLLYPKVPVSYLLLWEAIKEAKKRGIQKFNFWGTAPFLNKKHPWFGLTLFKMGFGGYQKEYVKTQDLVLSSKYWIFFAIDTIRKIKKGL